MEIACLDLEGVLIPEIWIAFADKTGIPELRLTTRDIPDYDVLMKQRLRILAERGLGLSDITAAARGGGIRKLVASAFSSGDFVGYFLRICIALDAATG
jgi:bifunctional phosphoserine phosphatase/homoserine phosphotransferase